MSNLVRIRVVYVPLFICVTPGCEIMDDKVSVERSATADFDPRVFCCNYVGRLSAANVSVGAAATGGEEIVVCRAILYGYAIVWGSAATGYIFAKGCLIVPGGEITSGAFVSLCVGATAVEEAVKVVILVHAVLGRATLGRANAVRGCANSICNTVLANFHFGVAGSTVARGDVVFRMDAHPVVVCIYVVASHCTVCRVSFYVRDGCAVTKVDVNVSLRLYFMFGLPELCGTVFVLVFRCALFRYNFVSFGAAVCLCSYAIFVRVSKAYRLVGAFHGPRSVFNDGVTRCAVGFSVNGLCGRVIFVLDGVAPNFYVTAWFRVRILYVWLIKADRYGRREYWWVFFRGGCFFGGALVAFVLPRSVRVIVDYRFKREGQWRWLVVLGYVLSKAFIAVLGIFVRYEGNCSPAGRVAPARTFGDGLGSSLLSGYVTRDVFIVRFREDRYVRSNADPCNVRGFGEFAISVDRVTRLIGDLDVRRLRVYVPRSERVIYPIVFLFQYMDVPLTVFMCRLKLYVVNSIGLRVNGCKRDFPFVRFQENFMDVPWVLQHSRVATVSNREDRVDDIERYRFFEGGTYGG